MKAGNYTIAQICNSHGFNNGWPSAAYHHKVFNDIVTQIQAKYKGNIIVIDHTWLKKICNEKDFYRHYPNITSGGVDHLFLIALVDPNIWHPGAIEKMEAWMRPKETHIIPLNCQFCFWGYYAQSVFLDYKNVKMPWNGSKLFLSYNRKPHVHRIALVNKFKSYNLMQKGIVTFGNDDNAQVLTIKENEGIVDRGTQGHLIIPNDVESLGSKKIWEDCLIDVVTETITYGSFLSEKIFKPIIGRRPFMVVGSPGTLRKLQKMGFKTFNKFWDEEYDRHPDHDIQPAIGSICKTLAKWSNYTPKYQMRLYRTMKKILDHNHNHFFGEFSVANRRHLLNIIKEER